MLRKAAKTPPKTDRVTGEKILYFGYNILLLGSVSILIAIFLIWMATVEKPPKDFTEFILFVAMTSFFLVSGIVSGIMYYKSTATISENGITSNAFWWGYPKSVRWEDIENISCSHLIWNSFIIRDKERRIIRLSYYFNGIRYLVNCFEKHLKEDIYSKNKVFIHKIKDGNFV